MAKCGKCGREVDALAGLNWGRVGTAAAYSGGLAALGLVAGPVLGAVGIVGMTSALITGGTVTMAGARLTHAVMQESAREGKKAGNWILCGACKKKLGG